MNKNLSRKLLLAFSDVIAIVVAIFLSFYLFGISLKKELLVFYILFSLSESLIMIVLFYMFGLYKAILKYTSIIDLIKIAISSLINFVFVGIFVIVSNQEFISMRYVAILSMLIFIGLSFIRFASRIFIQIRNNELFPTKESQNNVMIVGAGDAGTTILRELQNTSKIERNVVCFIDDDPKKLNTTVMGVPVVGLKESIPENAIKYNIKEIIVAVPSLPRKEQQVLLKIASKTNCKISFIPGIYQLVDGTVSVRSIRHVEITDLLGRGEIKVNLDEIMGYIENRVVLVTGGGGSIGSELCRQIADHHPKQLIILDIYENNAYDIQQELKRNKPNTNLLVLIASIRDKGKLEDIFKKYKIDIVFNAAAHKHVPLMETSPNEAIKNNVFGTLNLATLSDKYKVKRFIQISTDKAVNPTNIMGASKRICEMIIQTIGRKSKNTEFVAVRFGNVLGSNGSVIPLFKQQIKEGGPVTVTDMNITRYFMTIPEAVMLVLQAGAYAKGGEIYVLDMGEPVRIYDLAESLIRLSGFKPHEDIQIKITGLRPGEKLYEERLMDEEGLKTTANGLINIAKPLDFNEETFFNELDELYKAAYEESDSTKQIVKELVPTYKI
ncbi:polysaccharide biosynthesis protein [bacterium]|nr:polysaccharide biosynthesis protein [bacterium]